MDSSDTNISSLADSSNPPQRVADETDRWMRIVVRSVFPMLVGHSLSMGWWIPWFYNWSGSDQSISPPIVEYVFGGLSVACAVSVLALPVLPKLQRVDPVRNPLIQPFGFRIVLIIVAAIVAGMFAYRDTTLIAIGVVTFIYPIVCALRLGIASASVRWRLISLYSCMYLPFAWIFGNDVFQGAVKQGSLTFAPILAGAPALLCALFIRPQQNPWGILIAIAVAGLEVLVGLWIIQLGARRAIAYQVVLLAVSVVTSFGFYALLRA